MDSINFEPIFKTFEDILAGRNKLNYARPDFEKHAAVLALDLVGFTELSDALDSEDSYHLFTHILFDLSQLIRKNHGEVHRFEGDFLIASFSDKKPENNAINTSISIHQYLKARSLLENKQFKARIGIASGMVKFFIHFGLLIGKAVDKSLNLEKKCPTGGVCLSQELYPLLPPKLKQQILISQNDPLNECIIREKDLKHWQGLGKFSISSIKREVAFREKREVAVFFLEFKGVYTMIEQFGSKGLEVFFFGMASLKELINSFLGIVDKFTPKSLMAYFFINPNDLKDFKRFFRCLFLIESMVSKAKKVLLIKGMDGIDFKIGLNFGEVARAVDPKGHFTIYGSTVNLASRMLSFSNWGEISCIDLKLLQNQPNLKKSMAKIKKIKGFPDLYPVFQLLSYEVKTKSDESFLDFPNLFGQVKKEISQKLNQYIKGQTPGRFLKLNIHGKKGIGKTCFLKQILTEFQNSQGLSLIHLNLQKNASSLKIIYQFIMDNPKALKSLESNFYLPRGYPMSKAKIINNIHKVKNNKFRETKLSFLELRLFILAILIQIAKRIKLVLLMENYENLSPFNRQLYETIFLSMDLDCPVILSSEIALNLSFARKNQFQLKLENKDKEKLILFFVNRPLKRVAPYLLDSINNFDNAQIIDLKSIISHWNSSGYLTETKQVLSLKKIPGQLKINLKQLLSEKIKNLSSKQKLCLNLFAATGEKIKMNWIKEFEEVFSLDISASLNPLLDSKIIIREPNSNFLTFSSELMRASIYSLIFRKDRYLFHQKIIIILAKKLQFDLENKDLLLAITENVQRLNQPAIFSKWGSLILEGFQNYSEMKEEEIFVEACIDCLKTNKIDKFLLLKCLLRKEKLNRLPQDFEERLKRLKWAKVLAKKLNNNPLLAETLERMGYLELQRGKIEQSKNYFLLSLDLHLDYSSDQNSIMALCNLGYILLDLGFEEKGLEYLVLAKEKIASSKGPFEGHINGILGNYFLEKKQIQKALAHYKFASKVFEKLSEKKWLGVSLGYEAQAKIMSGLKKEGLKNFKKSIAIHRSTFNYEYLAYDLCRLSGAKLLMGEKRGVKHYLEEAEDLLNLSNFLKVQLCYFAVKGKLFHLNKNKSEADNLFKEAINLKEKLKLKENSERLYYLNLFMDF